MGRGQRRVAGARRDVRRVAPRPGELEAQQPDELLHARAAAPPARPPGSRGVTTNASSRSPTRKYSTRVASGGSASRMAGRGRLTGESSSSGSLSAGGSSRRTRRSSFSRAFIWLAQALQALRRPLLRRHLLGLDAVVVPVQLLAEVVDAAEELALSRRAGRDGGGVAEEQLLQAAGLRLLHVGERLLPGARARLALQGQLDQAFVDLELVLHERDLQLLAAQAAAQRLQELLGAAVGVVGAGRAVPPPAPPGPRRSGAGSCRAGRSRPARLRGGASQACRAERRSPVRKAIRARRSRQRMALLATAGDAKDSSADRQWRRDSTRRPGAEQDQGLVQLEERGPGGVLLARRSSARASRAQPDGAAEVPLLAVGDGEEAEGLRALVAVAEPAEARARLLRHLHRLLAQVQVQVDLGQVQHAQRGEVGVARGAAGLARGLEGFDRASVLPAKVVEVGDVVVGEGDQARHAVLRRRRRARGDGSPGRAGSRSG